MLYELRNKDYVIQVDSLGAELKSVLYKDEEYLYQGDTKYWHRSSPVLFPIVGRLKNNNYRYKNKNYTLPIHGFARHSEFTLKIENENENETSLTFILKENTQSLKHYPFSFLLCITYTLHENGFELSYEVSSQEALLFSLGAHPAFLLKASIDDTYIEFEKKETADLLCLNLDYGCIGSKKNNYLNSSRLKLHNDIFAQDALIFKNLNSKKVSLKNGINEKSINVAFDGFEYLAFWAPVDAPFVCIEPWCGIADDIHTNHELEDKTSIIKLSKNEVFRKSLWISLN